MRFVLERMPRFRGRTERSVDRSAAPVQRALSVQAQVKATGAPCAATERAFFDGSVMIW
jgi:hypothetical protein